MILPTRLLRSEWPPNVGLTPGGSERFDRVITSVQEVGILEPLTINLQWMVVDGNHRLNAARVLGIETVPVRVWTGSEFVE